MYREPAKSSAYGSLNGTTYISFQYFKYLCVLAGGEGGDSKGKRGFMVTGEKNLPLISQKVICSINYGCFIHIYIHALLYAVT